MKKINSQNTIELKREMKQVENAKINITEGIKEKITRLLNNKQYSAYRNILEIIICEKVGMDMTEFANKYGEKFNKIYNQENNFLKTNEKMIKYIKENE